MKLIILAGGKGSRLLPHTLETPKILIEIKGKKIIQRIIEALPEELDEIIIVVKHLQDKIRESIGNNYLGKKINFIEQGEKSGTFGALLSVKNLFEQGERFLVTNGDDVHDKYEYVECMKYPRAMAVQKKIMPNYYKIETDENGYFKSFKNQTDEEKGNSTLVATGVYVLDTKIFDHPGVLLSTGEYGLPQTVSEQSSKYPVKVVKVSGWVQINTKNDMEVAEKYFEEIDQKKI